MLKTIYLVLGLTACATDAWSDDTTDIVPFVHLNDVPGVLSLVGPIGLRAPLAFKRALDRYPDTRVIILHSEGGSVQAALLMAQEIHQRHLSTLIPEDFVCASACAYMFFAGDERLAFGKLGVHQISGTSDVEDAQLNLSDVLEALAEYGVSSEVITKMLRTPPDDIYFFSPAEVSNLGINRGTKGVDVNHGAPTPDPTKQLSDADRKANARNFVLGLITMGSAPKSVLLDLSSKVYSDSVSFYGKTLTKAEVLEDKAHYAERWPVRSSVVRQDSLQTECQGITCTIRGIYDWQVYDHVRGKRASGAAEFHYVLRMGEQPHVIIEDGKVLSRNKK